jgi:hypothetical protein
MAAAPRGGCASRLATVRESARRPAARLERAATTSARPYWRRHREQRSQTRARSGTAGCLREHRRAARSDRPRK